LIDRIEIKISDYVLSASDFISDSLLHFGLRYSMAHYNASKLKWRPVALQTDDENPGYIFF
jgi:hypothetical protein